MSIDRKEAARLLSGRDKPSVLEREAMFEAVWQEVKPRKAQRQWQWVWAAAIGAAAASLMCNRAPHPQLAPGWQRRRRSRLRRRQRQSRATGGE